MYDTATILVILGSFLFVLAVLGGGIAVKEVQVPPIQSRVRILLYPVSIAFIVGGVWLSRQPPPANLLSTVQPTSNAQGITLQPVLETETQSGDPFSCTEWSDDFSQPAWGDDKVDWGSWGYENGEYRMSLYAPNYFTWRCKLCSGLYQKDFRISVTARTPQNKGSWGIYFWGKDKSNYSFELDKGGSALIKQYDSYDFAVLGNKQIEMKATNYLIVEYSNGEINGFVNGEKVVTVPMESPPILSTYGVGLIQASLSSDSAEVFFDDFIFSGCP